MTAVVALLLAATQLGDAPTLPSVVTVRPKERRAFRPPCVVEALGATPLPKGVSVEVGEELLLVGADFNIAVDVELACRFSKAVTDAEGKLQCPEGSQRSAAESPSGETLLECLGGRSEKFRLDVREDAPLELLPKEVVHFAGERAAYGPPCRMTPRPASASNAWLEVRDASQPFVVAERAGETIQTYFCLGQEDREVRIKVLRFEKRQAMSVTAFSKGSFGMFVGESRAFFAPCEFETFEKTTPNVELKKHGEKAWLLVAKKPGVGVFHFGCKDERKISVGLEVVTATKQNVKPPEKNLVVLYKDEVRLFPAPCSIARLAVTASSPDLKPVAGGLLQVRGTKGKSTALMWCTDGRRESWLVETLGW